MSAIELYLTLGMAIFLLALHGLMTLYDPIRRLIAVNLMGAGTFLVMVSLARRSEVPDPVLHALVVTGLVVAISATAFALRLIIAASKNDKVKSADGQTSARGQTRTSSRTKTGESAVGRGEKPL